MLDIHFSPSRSEVKDFLYKRSLVVFSISQNSLAIVQIGPTITDLFVIEFSASRLCQENTDRETESCCSGRTEYYLILRTVVEDVFIPQISPAVFLPLNNGTQPSVVKESIKAQSSLMFGHCGQEGHADAKKATEISLVAL